jgi:hypothetical protein
MIFRVARAGLWAAVRAAVLTERGRLMLLEAATLDPDVGRYLLEKLAGVYGAKLELRE